MAVAGTNLVTTDGLNALLTELDGILITVRLADTLGNTIDSLKTISETGTVGGRQLVYTTDISFDVDSGITVDKITYLNSSAQSCIEEINVDEEFPYGGTFTISGMTITLTDTSS